MKPDDDYWLLVDQLILLERLNNTKLWIYLEARCPDVIAWSGMSYPLHDDNLRLLLLDCA